MFPYVYCTPCGLVYNLSMTTTQTQPTSQISDETVSSREAEVSRLKMAGYDAVENMTDAEYNSLPEDWEDRIVDEAVKQVWGSWEAWELAIS